MYSLLCGPPHGESLNKYMLCLKCWPYETHWNTFCSEKVICFLVGILSLDLGRKKVMSIPYLFTNSILDQQGVTGNAVYNNGHVAAVSIKISNILPENCTHILCSDSSCLPLPRIHPTPNLCTSRFRKAIKNTGLIQTSCHSLQKSRLKSWKRLMKTRKLEIEDKNKWYIVSIHKLDADWQA